MQAIINGEMHEIEPAVKVILDRVMCENAELKRENKRLEEGYQKATGVIAATDCVECKKDAEPVKHGEWETTECIPLKSKITICSACNASYLTVDIIRASRSGERMPDYCPSCGAKMDLKDGENNE